MNVVRILLALARMVEVRIKLAGISDQTNGKLFEANDGNRLQQ